MKRKAYHTLCTEFYDLSKPIACPEEISFYANAIKKAQGPILEAMCGSGRLLLPLLKLEYTIDGVDNSSEMLESCRKRCQVENLKVNLFHQSIENLSLKKYALIYIAVGSFQLISDRERALQVLRTLHSHLLPGGTLLLDTFIPRDSIQASIQGEGISTKTISSDRKISCSDGAEIFLKSNTEIDPLLQIERSKSRYDKYYQGKLLASEEEELDVRWYYTYEMELFLEKAGFSQVKMSQHAFVHNPHSLVYTARTI